MIMSTCFRNRIGPCTLYLSLFCQLSGFHRLLLHVFAPFDYDLVDNVFKELGVMLSRQKGNLHEFKFHECSFPDEVDFVFEKQAAMRKLTMSVG